MEAAWAAARAVVIGGAAGPKAGVINGLYNATADREVYAKAGVPGAWLFVAQSGDWMVGDTAAKDARQTRSTGVAFQVAAAGGRPPAAGPAVAWKVDDGTKSVEQRLRVEALDAAAAAAAAARREAEQARRRGPIERERDRQRQTQRHRAETDTET